MVRIGLIKMIKMVNVDKQFGKLWALKNINLEISAGEKLVVIGLPVRKKHADQMYELSEKPTSGQIFVDGIEITAHKAPVAKIETIGSHGFRVLTSILIRQFWKI